MSSKEKSEWIKVDDFPPGHIYEFGWAWPQKLTHPRLSLAYRDYHGKLMFQDASTVGDSEGLSVEYYEGVTHFMPLSEPEPPQ